MSTETESKFYDLSEDSILKIEEAFEKMALPFNLKKKLIGVNKQKALIKLQKVNPITQHVSGLDLLIMINEDYLAALEGENADILINQELDRLEFDINKGTFKIGKFKLQTTEGVLKKYGIEAVAKANQLSELYKQQKDDDQEFDQNSDNVKKKIKSVKKSSVEFE